MKIKIYFFCFFAALLLFFASCKSDDKKHTISPIEVSIDIIDSIETGLTRTYVGEIEENSSIGLSFPTGGTISKKYVKEGDYVQKGQLILSIDKQNLQNSYLAAKAILQQAEDGYNRLKKVYEQGSVAEVKWVEMLTNLEKARSLEQIAKKQLNDADIYAPISGVIGHCDLEVGSSVLPGQTAITLLDMQKVGVTFSVPENEIANVNIDDKTTIIIPALNNAIFSGQITDKSVSSNKISHSYQVKVALSNNERKLLPGMVCKVYLNQANEIGYIIPAKTVQTRPEGLSVWLIKSGKAIRQPIESNEFVANGILITSGLQQGDTIVTAGFQKLYNNAAVIIRP